MAYARIEPFGPEIEDFRAGQICATVANFAGKAIPKEQPAKVPRDFIDWEPLGAVEPEPVEELHHEEAPVDLERLSQDILSLVLGIGEKDGNTRQPGTPP